MLPELLGADPNDRAAWCKLAVRWKIVPELAYRLSIMAAACPFGLNIISGYRTAEKQAELEREGRPTAPDALSTHRSCPATGADLLPVNVETSSNVVRASFGAAAVRAGLRWGGGSELTYTKLPANAKPPPGWKPVGIPKDWNHVDLGPRQ